MVIDDKIGDENLQHDIKKEAVKITLTSGKIDNCKYLTGEEIFSSNQRQAIEEVKFTYSH